MTALPPSSNQRWFVYLIECVDRSVYTGIATDVARRYAEHQAGQGARYTRSHPPVRLLGTREYPDRSSASRAEAAIKRLSPLAKRSLAADPTVVVTFIEPRRSRARGRAARGNVKAVIGPARITARKVARPPAPVLE